MIDLSDVKVLTWDEDNGPEAAIRKDPESKFITTRGMYFLPDHLAKHVADKDPQLLVYFSPPHQLKAPAFLFNCMGFSDPRIMIKVKDDKWLPIRLTATGKALSDLSPATNVIPLFPQGVK